MKHIYLIDRDGEPVGSFSSIKRVADAMGMVGRNEYMRVYRALQGDGPHAVAGYGITKIPHNGKINENNHEKG